ncbi:dol-P-Glc:Glc(2)Man(9)GlcNAc(2)-PP-Dol alpha-1,2-glucosyltransferase isoform X4 [Salvia hispanica]|uniref:dol-P-Glc:Glc(2)Man(9)GlcNAc(2)-PP-Dol alpha-1,2-glucosyltransferase isoform X4 n=1 Tax=Salvia hispanica TaxID=49212 RepID=UPI00200936AF|nr:dol-P-Glc:Glc(2)Man(9)GlcNAc(2)-PP-Dol alpha-1,2-glucosyltransferase isoform X4 [Salvia hispanica]
MGRTAVASVVTLCLIPVHLIVNRFVPDPYMDEIFHVPQAQHYCRGNFTSWDPMITTPPGLIVLHASSAIVFRLMLYFNSTTNQWCSCSILKKKYICSSLLGAVSVLVRQTNIIWLLFVACTGVIEFAQSHLKDREEEIDKVKTAMQNDDFSDVHKGVSVISKLRKRRVNNGMRNQKNLAVETLNPMVHSSGLLDEIYSIVLVSWNHLLEISVLLSPFLMVFAAFIAFVCWNGSIVLGAKDAHTVSPHFSQFLYYGVVSSLFTFPVHFSFGQASTLSHQLLKNRLLGFFQGFMALALAFLSVKFFSIAHPYLLADNRHYPFYLWRKVINRHWSTKYLMIPFYIYSWFSIVCNLAKNQKKLWVLVYVLACAATLIPTPLIEFRYYTIPFFFMVLHSDIIDNMSWLLLGFLYLCINFFTMYMFLFRPFSWAHEAGTQRFIW